MRALLLPHLPNLSRHPSFSFLMCSSAVGSCPREHGRGRCKWHAVAVHLQCQSRHQQHGELESACAGGVLSQGLLTDGRRTMRLQSAGLLPQRSMSMHQVCANSCRTHRFRERGQWACLSHWLQTMRSLVLSSQLQWCSIVDFMSASACACNWLSEWGKPPMQTMCSTRCWQTPHSACRQMMGAAVMCRLPQQPMEAERLRTAGNPLRGILPRTSF